MTTVSIDSVTYPVAHSFSDARAIINYMGLFVFVDRGPSGWDLSPVPARDESEHKVMRQLTAPMEGKVVVTSETPDLPEGDGVPGGIEEPK